MSRTFRAVSPATVPGKRRKRGRGGDRHIQRLPPRSATHDCFTARHDWSDERGGLSLSRARRLTDAAHVREGLMEIE